jgi:uracil-DNA glycosylase
VSLLLEEISSTLQEIVKSKIVYPELKNVFRALIPIERIKLVVVGQDPYHNGSATGFAFDVKKGNSINPSLRNIYIELKNEGYTPVEDGNLQKWSRKGVLLLNTALTVEEGSPNSHTELWSDFTTKLVEYIAKKSGAGWLLMGSKAIAYTALLPSKTQIFKTSHPSPFSASKSSRDAPAFLGSGIFKQIESRLDVKIFCS